MYAVSAHVEPAGRGRDWGEIFSADSREGEVAEGEFAEGYQDFEKVVIDRRGFFNSLGILVSFMLCGESFCFCSRAKQGTGAREAHSMASRSLSSKRAATTFLPMPFMLTGSFHNMRSIVESAKRLLLVAGTIYFSS